MDSLWQEIKEEYSALMPNVDTADVEIELWGQHNRHAPAIDICQATQT